jgi:hypothetical protein
VVQLLIEHGADVRAGCDAALQLALKHGRAKVVQLLINHIARGPPGPAYAHESEQAWLDAAPARAKALPGYETLKQSIAKYQRRQCQWRT